MRVGIRSLGFLVALAGMIPLGAQSRPAVRLTLASAELAEGDALRVSVKAEGFSGQRLVLADGATLLAEGVLNLRGEAELVVRNLAPGKHRIIARLPRRTDLRSDVTAVHVTGEELPPATAADFWIAAGGDQSRRHAQIVEGELTVNQQRLNADGALAAAALDANLDGRMDLLVATREGLLLLVARLDGTFDPAVKLARWPEGVPAIANLLPGDWNGDGQWDVLLGTGAGVELWVAGGGPGLERKFRETTYRQPVEEDVNGDGMPDVLVERTAADGKTEPWVWMGTAAGGFVPAGAGRLGEGKTTQRLAQAPVNGVNGSSGFTAIAGGAYHSVALKGDGTVWAWGRNDYGEVGDGSTINRLAPVLVSGLTGVVAISAGHFHSLALKGDGTVWAWGNSTYGQLGDGSSDFARSTPVQVTGLTGVVAISGGGYHNLALLSDGTVRAWGKNTWGQLGDGTTTDRRTTVPVGGLSGVAAIRGGGEHSLALKSDGTVRAWGINEEGELGDGTTIQRLTPVQVSGLSGVAAIASGWLHGLALLSDGTVRAWGYNFYSQIGDGSAINRLLPVPVSGLTGVAAIAAGGYQNLALKSGGALWGWGRNDIGQLGDGTTTPRPTAIPISGLTGLAAVAGGGYHSLALKSDGSVWASGFNGYGELGDGSTTPRVAAVLASGPGGVTISGQVTKGGLALAGVTVTLTGTPGGTRTTDAAGNYSFTGLPVGGNYTVTPTLAAHTFTPLSSTYNNLQANQTANFTGQAGNGPPTVVGVIPASGATATQAFTFSFTDPNGWQDLGVVNVLVNFWLDGRNSCYLAYSQPANTLYLVNNAGDGYAGSMLLNGSGSVGNSQCTVNGAGSSVSGNGNTMNLTLNMTFPASFGGTKVMYLAARDSIENNSGWQRMGVWKVPGAAQTTTTAVAGMSPARETGSAGMFTFNFTDTNGANDLGVMNILVNDWLDGRHACYLAYVRSSNTLYLMNDNGDTLLAGLTLNGSGSLGNSQCTVNGVGSSATPSGNTLTLTLNMTFSGGFAGNRVFYLAARDVNALNNTGWQAMGSRTVP